MKGIISRILMACIAVLPFDGARAGMIGTPSPAPANAGVTDRAAIGAFLERAEVSAQLATLGVDPAAARARVDALTDEEAGALAQQVRAAPAGSNAGPGLVIFIIVVLVGFLICSAELVVAGKRPAFCF